MQSILHLPGHAPVGIDREELIDVPAILAAAGVQLQQNEIGRSGHGQKSVSAGNARRPREDLVLPHVAPNHDVDIAFVDGPNPHNPQKGIIRVAAPRVDGGANGQG